MKAKVTKAFSGIREGESEVVQFKEGDVVDGELAKLAIKRQLAVELWARIVPPGEDRTVKAEPGA